MQCLKDGDAIAQLGKLSGTGKSRRTGADHRHTMPVEDRRHFLTGEVFPGPVRHEPLQPSDCHRFSLDAPDTPALALALLGTDTTAHSRQGVGLADHPIGAGKVPLCHPGNEVRDLHRYRTALHTGTVFAAQAAGSFFHCHLRGIAQCHFLKVLISHKGVLYRHFHLVLRHILHLLFPPVAVSGGSAHLPDAASGSPDSGSPPVPAPDRCRCASSAHRNPPDARRNRGHPRRQTSPDRPL